MTGKINMLLEAMTTKLTVVTSINGLRAQFLELLFVPMAAMYTTLVQASGSMEKKEEDCSNQLKRIEEESRSKDGLKSLMKRFPYFHQESCRFNRMLEKLMPNSRMNLMMSQMTCFNQSRASHASMQSPDPINALHLNSSQTSTTLVTKTVFQ